MKSLLVRVSAPLPLSPSLYSRLFDSLSPCYFLCLFDSLSPSLSRGHSLSLPLFYAYKLPVPMYTELREEGNRLSVYSIGSF